MGLDQILDISYFVDSGTTMLKLILGGSGGKRVVTVHAPFDPYFFIKKRDLDRAQGIIPDYARVDDVDAITVEGEKVVKISVPTPPLVRVVRERLAEAGIESYEADIPYTRRVMIDLDLKVAYPERVAAFDIEVDATKGFPDINNPQSRVLSISVYDGEEEIFLCSDDEIEMFKEFNKLLRKYDVMIGWNSAAFDYPYLVERAKRLGYYIDEDMFQHVDIFGIFQTYFKREMSDFKLKTVALKVLGSKVPLGALLDFERPGDIAKLTEFFEKRRDLLRLYNMDQTKAIWMINNESGVLQTYITQARLTNILPWHRDLSEKQIAHRKYISYNKMIENLVLKKALSHKPRIVFPSKKKSENEDWDEDNKESSYTGAIVFDPSPGLWENVVLLDFATMYPRVIMTFNISYDTWTPNPGENDILAPRGGFITSREGFLPMVLRELEGYRSLAKKLAEAYEPGDPMRVIWNARQFAFKLILVSAYGVAGFRHSRLYRVEIAESITGYTRDAIMKAREVIEKHGWKVLYGDTDSLFIYNPKITSVEKAVDAASNELLPAINSFIRDYVVERWRVPKSRVVLEFKVDRVYSKLKLLSVKKRYYGLVAWEEKMLEKPYIQIKGLEARRGDWPDLVKEIQSEVIRLYLLEGPVAVNSYLKEMKRKLLSGEIPLEKLAIKKHLNKRLDEYKHNTPHYRAAKKLLEMRFPVRTGDRIEFIYLDDRVIPLVPGLKLSEVDLKKWWRKYVIPVVERLEIEGRGSMIDKYFR
jgi:DNA polymerase I